MTVPRSHVEVPVVIRQAGDADADFVAGFVESLLEHGSPAWDSTVALAPGFRQVLLDAVRNQGSRSIVLIAEVNETRVGFISLKVVDAIGGAQRAHVADLAVTESARRQGVGSKLMQAAEIWGRERGLRTLSLDVWACNEPALRFYASGGYIAESTSLIKSID